MAKIENRKMVKGWTPMSTKWNNMGKPRKTMGGKTTKIPDKRYSFKR